MQQQRLTGNEKTLLRNFKEYFMSMDPITGEQKETSSSETLAKDTSTMPSYEDADDLSFAEMLAEQEREETQHTRLSAGQRVSARIVAITSDTVFVSTGTKVDGIVEREELEVDGELSLAVNDVVDLYVVSVTPQEVKLSKILRGAGNLSALEDARDAGLPVEGKVTGVVKGGYSVDIMKRRAFCPGSQIALRPLDDPESVVGQTFAFAITKLEKGGRDLVLSRRRLLEAEQAESLEKVLADIHEGDVLEGVVTRFATFGAFVEIAQGVEGLVHLSELSWARVAQADEAVSLGDNVRVKVQSIDKTDKGVRFSLSMKAVTEDPWKSVNDRLKIGDTVTGKVVRLAQFGAFVEVLPGIEGLIHLSEFSYEKRIMKADEMVVVGDTVSVKIKEIELDKKRVSLSLRDVAGDPWATAVDTFQIGQEVMGTVEKRAQFGLFISIAPGITGLLPASVIQASPSKKDLERLTSGDAVNVAIRNIDTTARRISLAPAGEELADDHEEKNWREHAKKEEPKQASVGMLGMALQAAMQKKKK